MCRMSLRPITDRALAPVTHGFFTRAGGASTGLFDSLNCGPGSGDAPAAVTENLARAAAALGTAPARLVTLHQTHSARCLTLDAAPALPRPRADAMVTATPGLALGVLTADCMAVLFADRAAGVAGAAHAGWKGALAGVLEATLDAMEGLGAQRSRVAAVIGPCIGPQAYEVGPEFVTRFCDDDPGNARFFAPGAGDRALFDLPGFGLHRLRRARVGAAHWTGHCTWSDPARFFSWRRTCQNGQADYGRLLSAILL
jgi:YfiH family protein